MADVVLILHKKHSLHRCPAAKAGIFRVFLQQSMKFLNELVPIIKKRSHRNFLLVQPFDLVGEPIMKRCHNFCAGLLAHFQPTYAVTDHRKYNFVPLRLSALHQKEGVLIRFFFPDIRIICGTKFHGSFPAFSAVFMFNFKKNRLFPFV